METPSDLMEVNDAESENAAESGHFVRQVDDHSLQAEQVLLQQSQSAGAEGLSPVLLP